MLGAGIAEAMSVGQTSISTLGSGTTAVGWRTRMPTHLYLCCLREEREYISTLVLGFWELLTWLDLRAGEQAKA